MPDKVLTIKVAAPLKLAEKSARAMTIEGELDANQRGGGDGEANRQAIYRLCQQWEWPDLEEEIRGFRRDCT